MGSLSSFAASSCRDFTAFLCNRGSRLPCVKAIVRSSDIRRDSIPRSRRIGLDHSVVRSN